MDKIDRRNGVYERERGRRRIKKMKEKR